MSTYNKLNSFLSCPSVKMADEKERQRPTRVFMWMVPRTNSTVFTKCMSFVDNTEVWNEPYMACLMNDTFYNPEWGKGDPVIDKLKEHMAELISRPEYLELMKEELENAKKHPNVWTQDKFR